MTTEIEALQNAATELNLVIYEEYTQDKRKKVKTYFANMGNETVSPTLPYNELNTFLLGWSKSTKKANKMKTRKPIKDFIVRSFKRFNTDIKLVFDENVAEYKLKMNDKEKTVSSQLSYFIRHKYPCSEPF